MVELIARNTIQRVLRGKFVTHAPGTRFEMLDADADHLIRSNAAVFANPQDVALVYTTPDEQQTEAPVVDTTQETASDSAVQPDDSQKRGRRHPAPQE